MALDRGRRILQKGLLKQTALAKEASRGGQRLHSKPCMPGHSWAFHLAGSRTPFVTCMPALSSYQRRAPPKDVPKPPRAEVAPNFTWILTSMRNEDLLGIEGDSLFRALLGSRYWAEPTCMT